MSSSSSNSSVNNRQMRHDLDPARASHGEENVNYSRLREHLFPTTSGNANMRNTIPSARVAETMQQTPTSSRFQQMIQSAVINNRADRTDTISQHFLNSLGRPRATQPLPQPLPLRSVAALHPSFRSKAVCQLGCCFCEMDICGRGMRAILLADTSVELYSTDNVSKGRVQLVGEDYLTENCQCRIRDVACLGCGNVVGYHVTQPCDLCLNSCNNGHFWMFLSDYVRAKERLDDAGEKTLVWAHLLDHVVEAVETVAR